MATQRRVVLYALVAVLLVGLVLVGVWRRQAPPNTLRIGSILVLSGDYKSLGEQIRDGQIMAADELNAEASRREKVELVFYDSQGQKDLALEKVRLLQRDGIRFVAEIFGSGPAEHCLPFITQQNMLFVSGVDTGPGLSGASRNFFRIIPSDTVAAGEAARWAIDQGIKTAAIAYLNDTWGLGLKTELEQVFSKLGGQIVAHQEISQNQDLFQPVVESFARVTPGVVFLFVHPREAALLVVEAGKRRAFSPMFVGTDNLSGSEMATLAGRAVLGVGYVVPGEAAPSAKAQQFTQAYQQRVGADKLPPLFTVMGYDATQLLVQAIDKSGGDVARAIEFLRGVKYEGVSGAIAFDDRHDVLVRPYQRMVFEERDGRVVPVAQTPGSAGSR